jgi:hypothetical protein
MKMRPTFHSLSRRRFLADLGMGFTGMALGATLAGDGIAREVANIIVPRAKSVIWIFLSGGYSHVETFDPKPAVTQYGGRSLSDTPFKDFQENPLVKKNVREVIAGLHKIHPSLYPLQVGFKKRGQSGIEVSDWWPHVSECIDDIACALDVDHRQQSRRSDAFHTGRHVLRVNFQPSAPGCITVWGR